MTAQRDYILQQLQNNIQQAFGVSATSIDIQPETVSIVLNIADTELPFWKAIQEIAVTALAERAEAEKED